MWSVLVVVFCVIGGVQATIQDCRLPKQSGSCKASFLRYYFDVYSKQCKTFRYGGCGGNRNNFRTLKECQEKCMAKPKFCLLCCGPPPCCNTCDQFTKPGFCPLVQPGSFGTCVEECSGDEGCPGDKKCCSNGCGHVCEAPTGGTKS
ncbi:chelonianin-like [Mytilus trossulus]|uniref:chelonianin-like n=1 Tax=Mytilus trossulus TaxID=6551 RepID=UPI003003E177